jgi:hypothetical protein
MNKDREHQIKAIELLDNHLSGVSSFPEETEIDVNNLIKMYMEARELVRLNVENLELNRAAESVWSTCIRVVRLSGLVGEDAKTLIINQKTNYPEAKSLYKHALGLYGKMKEQENC